MDHRIKGVKVYRRNGTMAQRSNSVKAERSGLLVPLPALPTEANLRRVGGVSFASRSFSEGLGWVFKKTEDKR